jgi:mono/diheme cytochrome c family protein
MRITLVLPGIALSAWLAACSSGMAALTPEQLAQLPAPANHPIDFAKEIKPIFEASCIKCHGRGRDKGGFQIDTRQTLLKGGDSGPAVVPGKSAESELIALVQGVDPDEVMPQKGTRLTPEQIGLLRAWIDQGLAWDAAVTFARPEPLNLKARRPEVPAATTEANTIDRFLDAYFAANHVKPATIVNDRLFARRVWLDVVGLLPPTDALEAFVADRHPDKRRQLVRSLLADNRNYAEHWLTFWNDALRNDYRGTGYIDGGRKQITSWLYSALVTNMPYDRFVAELIDPVAGSEGFTRGIVWRGTVNASQTPQMQAAQNISQVFMGVNLKCASCHDSFVNDFTLADAYGLAGLYADGPLEMVHCDKPTGKKAALKFIYPELGAIDASAGKPVRLEQLAECVSGPKDGRLTRTLVNRFWGKFLGRALVEPVDEMEQRAWDPDLLDWLAEDFAGHHYDVKYLIEEILTSRAYELPAVDLGEKTGSNYVFRGPGVRRLSAEEFRDALASLTGIGYSAPVAEVVPSESERRKFAVPVPVKWLWNDSRAAEKGKAGHVYFRKSIQLTMPPADGMAVVMCDNSFTLFVNGQKAGSGNDYKNAYLFDLRPFLKPGENLFAVDAMNNLPDNTPPTPDKAVPGTENPAGFLFYARLRQTEAGKSQTNDFGSDKSWLVSDAKQDGWENPKFAADNWQPAAELGDPGIPPWRVGKDYFSTKLATVYPGKVRASMVAADPLQVALGRPNREQVVTTRPSAATTLQALEMTNGGTLADILKRGAENLLSDPSTPNDKLVRVIYEKALGRKPTERELTLARGIVGQPAQAAGVEDLLWAITMLPEFQLIY